ncbi:MAG: hypothetical protein D084_Lepto4C00195G0001 [Leptospirillum sp. Group IV 'UBA BS']|nr:MAG: hypothetical protein D084_Lepto4C00195G0001 [Leptospirillum sp. Group IV 'UBA BS']
MSSKRIKRLAVFYPFGDFNNPKCGAAIRVNYMVKLLSSKIEEIRVMQRWNKPFSKMDNVRVESPFVKEESIPSRIFDKTFRGLSRLLKNESRFNSEEMFLRQFLEPYVFPEFKRSVQELLHWSDAVILEFPFWGRLIEKEIRKDKKPYIITDHDFLSSHINFSPTLKHLVKNFEIKTLKNATHVVSVSETDSSLFYDQGIPSQVIANSTDCIFWGQEFPGDPKLYLKKRGITLPDNPFCFFVGGSHNPNKIAVKDILYLSSLMNEEGDPSFVLAGTCSTPGKTSNLISLGRVDSEILLALYKACDIVLVPLKAGSGSSVKTIEAMAAGGSVIGTTVGFRTLGLENGRQVIIENDIENYPGLIRMLLKNTSLRQSLGHEAKIWAFQMDYRRIFQTYFNLLGLPAMDNKELARMEEIDRENFSINMKKHVIGV